MPRKLMSGFVGLILPVLFAGSAFAEEHKSESMEPVLLTLVDEVTDQIIELTEKDLLAFEQVVVLTENEFVDGMGEFTGPLARDVLALFDSFTEEKNANDVPAANIGEITSVDVVGKTFTLTAVNDYAVQIPAEDFLFYDVIFAMYQDGERLSLRTKGPIWVVYPMSEHSELQDRTYNDRLIWQLAKVAIE